MDFHVGSQPIDPSEFNIINFPAVGDTAPGGQGQDAGSIGSADKKNEKKTIEASLAVIPFPFITYMPQSQMIHDLSKIAAAMGMTADQLQALYASSGSAARSQEIAYSSIISFITDNMVKSAQISAERSEQNMAEKRKDDLRMEMIRQGIQHEQRGAEMARGVGEPQPIGGMMAMGAVLAVGFPAAQLFGNSVIATLQVFGPASFAVAIAGLASMVGASVVARAGILSLAQAGQGEKVYNKEYVDNLSKEAIAAVSNSAMTSAIKGALMDLGFSEEEATNRTHIVQTTFLLDALAIGYKAETGGPITSQEMQGLLDGTITLPKGDPRNDIIAMINVYSSFLPKSTSSSLLDRYYAYLDDERPSFDDLLNPADAIHSMFQPVIPGTISA